MNHLKLTPTHTKNRDLDFLIKLPVLPYRFLFNKHNFSLAIYKPAQENEPYYLKTDYEKFIQSYLEYYSNRFEVEQIEGDISKPEGYSTLIELGTFASSEKEEESAEQNEKKAIKSG